MKTLATQQPTKNSAQQEQHGDRVRSPLAVNGARSWVCCWGEERSHLEKGEQAIVGVLLGKGAVVERKG